MKLSDFDYTLPKEQIAKVPAVPRDSSKLLVLNRITGEIIDDHFYNLANYLNNGDVLVRNNTKVIPARIFGFKHTGGKVEILLTKKIAHSDETETWECLTKPGLKPDQELIFSDPSKNLVSNLKATCLEIDSTNYTRIIKFNQMGPILVETLEKIGITPLPPYIADTTKDSDDIRKKYQTIYAKYDGSAAAPTAGLHFTKELQQKIIDKGVKIVDVTLHVGLGTFLPVKTENILHHQMHSEWFELTKDAADVINKAKSEGKRIICVGTTSSRVLESAAEYIEKAEVSEKNDINKTSKSTNSVKLIPQTRETDIFMYPGYKFKSVDSLITNFHLPKSTLLMLVSAFVCYPNTQHKFTNFLNSFVGQAYTHAIENNYRFYSFGDGMIII